MGVDPEVLAVLKSAGLGNLVDRFAAEEIDGTTLWSLQDDDLRELGLDAAQRGALLDRLASMGAAPARVALPRRDGVVPVPLALAAAEQALQRSALPEAAGFLRQADASLAGLSEAAADPLRLRVLIAKSAVARAQQGIASDEAGRLGRQVLQLAQKLRETRSELMALTGLYTHALVRAEYFNAGKWADLLCERAAQAQDETFRMIGRRGTGVVALHTGALTQAVMALQEALDAYDEAQHLPLAHAHGYDHAEITSAFLSFALWITGDPVGGRGASDFSVSHSRRIGHMHSLAQALVFRAMLMAVAHEWGESGAAGEEAEAVGRQHALVVMGTAGGFFAAAAHLLARPGLPSAAEMKALAQAHADFRRVNPHNYQQVCGLLLAILHLRSGAHASAEASLLEAEAMQARTRETFLLPELMRMRARVLEAKGEGEAARETREGAFAAATRMGATMLALRIACDMVEASPSPASRAHLAAVCSKLVSADRGADVKRCEALLTAAP